MVHVSKMKWRVLVSGLVLVFLGGGRSNATIWCGRGGILDHQCSDADTSSDPAVTRAMEKYRDPWMDLTGVWSVGSATSAAGGLPQIQVMVDPPWAGCAESRILSTVGGVSTLIVPKSAPHTIQTFSTGIYSYPPPPPPSRNSAQNANGAEAYSRTLRQYGRSWMALPGVIGISPAGCDCTRCDYSGVEIDVQRQFLRSVKKQIPSSVDGVTVKILSRD
jgi:hypothetical protein